MRKIILLKNVLLKVSFEKNEFSKKWEPNISQIKRKINLTFYPIIMILFQVIPFGQVNECLLLQYGTQWMPSKNTN